MRKVIFWFLILCCVLSVNPFSSFSEETNVNINASLDVGKNTKEMVEKLATMIGVTSDKIFPYYVKQVKLSSLISIIISTCLFLGCLTGFFITYKKCDWKRSWESIDYLAAWFTFFSVMSGLIVCIVLSINITSYLNPEYTAIQSMVSDASKLLK